MARRFNSPPNWPPSPPGWTPLEGWQPDPTWPAPPAGWELFVDEPDTCQPSGYSRNGSSQQQAPTASSAKVGFFGARKRAEKLSEEISNLREEMRRLGVLDVLELQCQRDELATQIADQEHQLDKDLERHTHRLAEESDRVVAEQTRRLASQQQEMGQLEQRLSAAKSQVVVTEDLAMLQEAGVYSYRHPLTDAVAYRTELARIQEAVKAMTRKDGGAIQAATNWTVDGSLAKGRAMVRDFSKLMLRAYNAEADNLVRGLRPYKLDVAVERLGKVALTIERLGRTMNIRVTPEYHGLRIRELELTADYQAKVAEEKEREREEKARLREQRQVQQEMERERQRLVREKQHYVNASDMLLAKGDKEGSERLQLQVGELEKAIADVDYRAANVRAGYVYVISNLGSFGGNMVKIGMTRRLEPADRIRELSDASVPFNFDVHAIFFSDDAVGIEAQMHERLSDKRVNRVNQRREFFYVTPAEARDHLTALRGDLLQYEDLSEALEFRQSQRKTQRSATD